MGIPSDTDEDNQEEDVQADSGFGNVLGAFCCCVFGAAACSVLLPGVSVPGAAVCIL